MRLIWKLLGGYYATSTFFLFNPQLIWSQHQFKNDFYNSLLNSDKTIVVGHRGGAHEGPQSTLQLFRQNDGHIDMIEADLCTTKDGQIVVNHDENMLRTCGVDKVITDIDYKDLPRMQKRYKAYGDATTYIDTTQNKLPLLSELYEAFPNKPMCLEVKTPTEAMLSEIKRLNKQHKRTDLTFYGFLSDKFNKSLINISDDTLVFDSQRELIKIFGLFLLGAAPFVPLRKGILLSPVVTDGFKYETEREFTGKWKYLIKPYYLAINAIYKSSPILVPFLKKRGILTFLFVINDEKDFEKAASAKCSGILSDRPAKLKEYLDKKGQHFKYIPKPN